MKFLYDRWYAAAWPHEIADKPFNRKILDEDITFYRKSDGCPVAVSSRCPHRFAPMYYGAINGDNIRCRYHGLEFGPNGACVLNPDGSVAPNARLKAYPVVEQDSMIWIWMGAKAPDMAVPDILKIDPRMGGFVCGLVHVEAHYQLLLDNLLDQSHAPHLHSMLKSEALIEHSVPEVRQEGDTIYNTSWAPGRRPAPFWLAAGFEDIPIDQKVDAKWEAPSSISVHAAIAPAGRPMEEGISNVTIHLMTPGTENTTLYFWCHARDFRLEDHEYSDAVQGMFQKIFTDDDKWMIEGQARMMGDAEFWSLKPVLLPQDRATALCRRHLDKLVAAQDGQGQTARTTTI